MITIIQVEVREEVEEEEVEVEEAEVIREGEEEVTEEVEEIMTMRMKENKEDFIKVEETKELKQLRALVRELGTNNEILSY